jgi:hypothetical protein
MRERRPGCWEIRVVVSSRPTVQRSFMVRGDAAAADARRAELVADFGVNPLVSVPAASMTVGELLRRFIEVPQFVSLRIRARARGEIAGLRAADLDGRVLRIERSVSGDEIGSTKTKRPRRITLGATTAAMIGAHLVEFPVTASGDWLFATDSSRSKFARPDRLSHRFDRVRNDAGITEASLHRFRHSVATYLVGKGRIVAAQYRLGHGHTGTTLRHYTRAVALEDTDIADDLDGLLNSKVDPLQPREVACIACLAIVASMTSHAVSEIQADAAEHGRVHAVLQLVSGADQKVVVGVGGEQVELPPSLVEALLAAADSLDAGDSVSIMSQTAEVSPAQAAKLLGVSRQYVDRLVEAEVLPSRRVTNSSYRRIPVRAVLARRAVSERKRAGINAIIDDAVASGLPY